ncbi:Dynein heavy chain 10, axonemal [Echinococcus granulosus]|uniref:Dynein-1, subspecies f n=1 Tax=Echinococcus granulosus TaxID=6210 RepID=W6V141_ECHGR|nr:Dynein heavy chain 10, axonemal [Echinococcus granulosus]EUB64627.1 Dynein heavy chain 10, axonemal [Echinococcus granulosus]
MDDNRILWIKQLVYHSFNLKSDKIFCDFLTREDEINRYHLEHFLNGTPETSVTSIQFTIKTTQETIFEEIKISSESKDDWTGSRDIPNHSQPDVSDNHKPNPIDGHESDIVRPESNLPMPNDCLTSTQTKLIPREIISTHLDATYGKCCFKDPHVQYLCLLRVKDGFIETFGTIEEAFKVMPSYFEVLFVSGNWLYQLRSILTNVYLNSLPMIRKSSPSNKLKRTAVYRNDEFSLKYHKFLQVVSESSELLNSTTDFTIPTIDLDGDEHTLLQNESVTSVIEATVIKWGYKMREIIEELNTRSTQGEGPLAVVEYWRGRATSLSRLVEQVEQPHINRVLNLYALKERIPPQSVFEMLHRCHSEATDNIKLLALAERYFKIITYCTEIDDIIESLCPLMQALQMIWIISPYFNKEDRMTVIFERIAWCLCSRVSRMLTPSELFNLSLQKIEVRIKCGRKLLESWKSTYMTRRADIEASGREYRWEFDKKRLFAKSDYMVGVCSDMEEVVNIVKEYKTMFGPEIKSVFSEQKHFDLLMENVLRLLEAFKSLQFDPLLIENKSKWRSQMRQFQMEVMALDTDAKSCLEDSFRTLHSSDKAFQVLQRLLESHPRKDIARLFEERYTDILDRYDKEVRLIETTFTEGSSDSGHFAAVLGPRYLPPVASSICWVRNLQARITSPMLKMVNIRRLMESDRGQEVQNHYLCLVQRMTKFEEDLFVRWRQQVHDSLGRLMERNLWKYTESSKPTSVSKSGHSGRLDAPLSKRGPAFGRELPKQSQSLYKFNFEVDFGDELVQIIEETKSLQMLGFPVPDMACCIALREKELLRKRNDLSDLAELVRTTLGRLSTVELVTLEDHIMKLQAALAPAWKQLNWTSLIIDRYLVKAKEAFDHFCGVLRVVDKTKAKMEANLNDIAKASLFRTCSSKLTEPSSLKVYLQQTTDARMRDFEDLARKHTEISTLLLNLEKVITGKAATGKELKMLYFYEYWERRCFDTVHQMVIGNLRRFLESLQIPSKPLFGVNLMLSGSEVVSTPQPAEFYQHLIQDVCDAIKNTQVFIRWKPGSCLPSQGIKLPEQEDIFLFSFHQDLVKSVVVKELFQQINCLIFRAAEELKRHQEKYRQHRHLFATHKNSSVEKWRRCNPSVTDIDQRINEVTDQLNDLLESMVDTQIGFFTLRTGLLVQGIQMHAKKWVVTYGELFREHVQAVSRQLRDSIHAFLPRLQVKPSERSRLKPLLSTIRDINDVRAESEEQLACIAECHRLLRLHNLEVTADEMNDFKSLRRAWLGLLKQARATERSLNRPRKLFKYTTKVEAKHFSKEIEEFMQRFKTSGPAAVEGDLDRGLKLMKEYNEELQGLAATYNKLLSAERLFDLPVTYSEGLDSVQQQIDSLARIYTIYVDHKSLQEEWSKVLWRDAHFSILQNEVERLQQTFQKLPKQIRHMDVGRVLETRLSEFVCSVTLLKDLKHEALRQRHWSMLMEKTKHEFALNPDKFTLGNIFDMHLDQFRSEIDEVLSAALKEFSIEKDFSALKDTWNGLQLEVKDYIPEKMKRGLIFGGLEEVIQTLDDSSLSLQSMSGSRFATPFLEEIRGLEKDLTLASEVLEIWVLVQRKWLHLETLFAGSDIHTRIPKEAEKFDKLNLIFKKTVEEATRNSYVRNWCLKSGRVEELQSIIAGFEICQKSLTTYLKTKRNVFPRFFFISDDELLMILGASEGDCAQEHIIKMFDNIICLELTRTDQGVLLAMGMRSTEGEVMKFKQPIECTGRIEEWMTEIEIEMKRSNRMITKGAIYRYCEASTRVEWALRYQGMVVLAASQVWWTWKVEDAFRHLGTKNDKAAMKDLARQQRSQLEEIVSCVRGDLSPNDRTKLTTLLIIDVHSRDVVDCFIRDSIVEAKDFGWQSQLRFYWCRSSDNLTIHQCNATFDYGYEYMGLNGRLVITPLTDRIYLTLTQALCMHLGACAAGPAGTGKTETVKDLAKALAILCLVTNCGDAMDYRSVGRIFSGLCQTGAWGCFDEFNRIEVSVLSVISAQLRLIQTAHLQAARKFVFESEEIAFNSQVGVFITMNPGYMGRTELPESLKVQFRQIMVAVPHRKLICEVMLFAQGFSSARILATKINTLYHLADRQLSRQHHYDFSMRTLKAVLQLAGELRRRKMNFDEATVIIRALREVNLPRLLHEDAYLFLDLIGDLFPGLSCPKSEDQELTEAVEGWLTSERFVLLAKQVEKVVQLHDTMKTRHATMVVGPTCGGKSVVIRALCGAQTRLGIATNLITLNPKDRNIAELYGVLDLNTRDWTDGLLSRIFRDANKPSHKKINNIILFDGDVDSLWVENMNSVMDDNRVLTLPNGERIRLEPTCCLLFEVGDLEYASPATVSRCGMVFVDPHDLDYSALWQRWKLSHKELDTFYIQILDNLFTKYIPRLMALNLNTVIPLTSVSLIIQLCHLLESLLIGVLEASADCLEALLLQALTFSFGSCLLRDSDRAAFDEKVKEISALPKLEQGEFGSSVPAGFLPDTLPRLEDYFFDAQNNAWVPWSSRVPHYRHDPAQYFTDIVVPTRETVVMQWVLETHAKVNRPILLIGETGTFKTASVNQFLAEQINITHQILRVTFSARTTALDLYNDLDANLEKRNKGLYGPRAGKRLLLFIDDLHMSEADPYGTQQPVALLKLLLTNHGFFDRSSSDFKWRRVLDTSYLAAMTTPCEGRVCVDPRCLSLFSLFHATPPRDTTLGQIFSSIFSGHLQTGSLEAVVQAVPAITQATLNVYTCSSLPQVARLWRHELFRVFVDRLSTKEDILLVKDKINAEAANLDPTAKEDILCDPILFGEYKTALKEEEAPYYEDVGDYNTAREIFSDIEEKRSKYSKLILFDDALEHLSRLHRIISTTGEHALCVGVSGTGKAALVELAAFAAGCEVFRITPRRNYAETDFREEIKTLYLRLVQENKKIVFLVLEDDIVDENNLVGVLEVINRMLVGMDANLLFSEEERETIASDMQQEAMDAGIDGSREGIWRYLSQKADQSLHIILTMSPVGNALRRRCMNFPGLLNNTTIDWFFAWPEEALYTVAKTILCPDNQLIPAAHYDTLIDHVVHVHRSVEQYTVEFVEKWKRTNYVTPKHFLDYIGNYLKLLLDNERSKVALCERFVKGVTKLEDAAVQVKELNEKLMTQRMALAQNTEACEALLKNITQNQILATEKRTQSEQKAKEMETQSKAIEQEKAAAENALAEALPALEQARAALGELDKNDVTEIRSFVKPPRPVQVVSECICVFKGLPEVSWKAAKGMMADANFLQSLQTMDVDGIGPKQLASAKERLGASKLGMEQMQSVSRAGAGFLRFVSAVLCYCEVLKDVRPKREKVAKLEKLFAQVIKPSHLFSNGRDLERMKHELAKVEEDIKKLDKEYSTAKTEHVALQEETAIMERRLAAADKLINGLSCESVRWRMEADTLCEARRHLVGDCLVSAAFLTYTGAFFYNLRHRMLHDDWIPDLQNRKIPLTKPFSLVHLLTDEVTVTNWKDAGLPGDDSGVQNGILTMRASRFPILIDPQQQALKWIKRLEENNSLRVATFNDPDFLKSLELSIKFGTPFLFENVGEYIDPIINNVLSKNILRDRNRYFVMLGDKEVEYDWNFRLYLNTKLPNPAYGPKPFGNAVVINYTITEETLENQLLGVIVKHEQSSLEEKKTLLIHTKSENRRILKDLEDSLLMNLTLSTGNLLDNEELVNIVEVTKARAIEAQEKLALTAKTAAEVEQLSNAYRSAAKRGALLFFALTDMATVNPMYQFGLSAYISLFEGTLHRSIPDTVLGKRLGNINSTLTEVVYNYGCTGFFERHKLLFSFQISLKLQAEAGRVSQAEVDFFTKGDVSVGKMTERCPIAWLTDTKWRDIRRLEEVLPSSFVGLSKSLVENQKQWKKVRLFMPSQRFIFYQFDFDNPYFVTQWFSLNSLECEPPPYFQDVSDFQKLCLLRCFRVDRVCRAVEIFVANTLGEHFLTLHGPSLSSVYEQSKPETPIIFILSPGSDPTEGLKKLADKSLSLNASSNIIFLSMGQGQESSAMKLFKTASSKGSWLVLQNCHLLVKWIPTLEKAIETTKQFHPTFRLWLTTESTSDFPIGFLHHSFKVVTEPLVGLKRNLRCTFLEIPASIFAENPYPEFPVLAYTLTFFHAVVQERRQYGKLGWNVVYDFNLSDFQASLTVIADQLKSSRDKSGLPWGSLQYLIEEIMYGGRVMDKFDQRVLHTYMNEYFGDFLFDTFQRFHFFINEELTYALPSDTSREGILRYIDTLPTNNSPEVLGLNPNAEINSFTSKAHKLWSYLLALGCEGESGSNAATTATAQTTLTIEVAEKVLQSLPPPFDREAIREAFKEKMTPTTVVLLQELEHFNSLVLQMQSTLSHLKQAMSGEVALTSDLEQLAVSLCNGQLPSLWRTFAPDTKKSLANWLTHLHRRTEQYKAWTTSGEPIVIWLSGLHVPESYLSAVVQSACRRNAWPLDKSVIVTTVTEYTDEEAVEDRSLAGCLLNGLFLEGASWNSRIGRLCLQAPRQLIQPLPLLNVSVMESRRAKRHSTLLTPVYVTSARADAGGKGLVFEADLAIGEERDASHWILQGVCLLLNDD